MSEETFEQEWDNTNTSGMSALGVNLFIERHNGEIVWGDELAALRAQLEAAREQIVDMLLCTDINPLAYGDTYAISDFQYNRLMRGRKAAAAWLAGQEGE